MRIAPDVHMLKGVGTAPIYLLVSDKELTLIDSGMIGRTDKVIAQIEEAGYDASALKTIVLTHYHHDHVGCAAELARRTGARIAAHRDEVVYITREKRLPATSLLKRFLFWLFDRVLLWILDPADKTFIAKVDLPLEAGDEIETFDGLQVIHVPGHTPGSIVLYHPARQMLFCGDAITNRSKIRHSPWYVSTDSSQALDSACWVANLPVETACFGHGAPILEQAGTVIKEAMEQYCTQSGEE
jgi:glyoxylase-like metal-dependent hydrolase (beta-lactamase superfamily II)